MISHTGESQLTISYYTTTFLKGIKILPVEKTTRIEFGNGDSKVLDRAANFYLETRPDVKYITSVRFIFLRTGTYRLSSSVLCDTFFDFPEFVVILHYLHSTVKR